MSSNKFSTVDPAGWEWDLQSVYSAYMGFFQDHGVPWYDRSWGHLFRTFEDFLEFTWPVIVVTDQWTGRAHIVTRWSSIMSFIKMVKTRYGETLPQVENILRVTAFETSQRPLRTITDFTTYKKIHASLPAAVLSATRTRVRAGEPQTIMKLWDERDKTFLAFDIEWSERNIFSCLEFGFAALRCGHLTAKGIWPPAPGTNYRKGHYIIAEYVDKAHNKISPNFPWAYAFGESQIVSKTKLPEIIDALLSSLCSPDSETQANDVILVGHGLIGDLERLHEMKIKIPHNVLILDTSVYERQLFAKGLRGQMIDPQGKSRQPTSTLSLLSLLRSLNIEIPCTLQNAGNDAVMTLLALQRLLDPSGDKSTIPIERKSAIPFPGPVPPLTHGLSYPSWSSTGPPSIRGRVSSVPNIHVAPKIPSPLGYPTTSRHSPATPATPLSGSTPSPGNPSREINNPHTGSFAAQQTGYFDDTENMNLLAPRRVYEPGHGSTGRMGKRRSMMNPVGSSLSVNSTSNNSLSVPITEMGELTVKE